MYSVLLFVITHSFIQFFVFTQCPAMQKTVVSWCGIFDRLCCFQAQDCHSTSLCAHSINYASTSACCVLFHRWNRLRTKNNELPRSNIHIADGSTRFQLRSSWYSRAVECAKRCTTVSDVISFSRFVTDINVHMIPM